jgi:hypothetical protein
VDGLKLFGRGDLSQDALRNIGQHRIRQDVVDVSGAALNFRAPARYLGNNIVVIGEVYFVRLRNPALNLSEF